MKRSYLINYEVAKRDFDDDCLEIGENKARYYLRFLRENGIISKHTYNKIMSEYMTHVINYGSYLPINHVNNINSSSKEVY